MRSRKFAATFLCFTFSLAVQLAPAQTSASFTPLGLGPGGVQSFAWDAAANAPVVVGSYWVPNGPFFLQLAFRWDSGIFQDLGALNPNAPEAQGLAVSADGSKVVGWSRAISGYQRPFLWSAATGMKELSKIPGSDAIATDISPDGTIVVGYFLDSTGYHAFLWKGGKVINLGSFPGGHDSKAQAVCGAGAAAVGSALQSDLGQRAFRWQPIGGIQNLGGLPGVQTSYAEGCSSDGSVVVGSSTDDKGNLLATRWDATGIRSLGALGGSSSEAHAVSADGSVVVGGAGLPFINGVSEFTAFRWTRATGKMEQLSSVLQNLGVTTPFCSAVPCPPGTWFLQLALGISSDGSVIVGFAQDPNGHLQAYRAVVPSTQ
jgi:probable HAF family extracellular repeat protein